MLPFLLQGVDRLSEWLGKLAGWLCLILMGVVVYDTLARYIFNAPTGWAYDISYMLYGSAFMLGAAWTLLRDEHVRIDLVHSRMSTKAKAIAEAVGYALFFFPSIGVLVYFSIKSAIASVRMLERSGETVWNPPIWPLKIVLSIALVVLLLQGIAQFVRCITTLKNEGGKSQ